MFERMLQKTCTIRHREEDEDNVNQYGDPEVEVSESDAPCEVQQIDREEPADIGETARTEWIIFLPQGTVLDTTDQIEYEGQLYEVTGEPDEPISIHNRWGFVEATMVRTGKVPSS